MQNTTIEITVDQNIFPPPIKAPITARHLQVNPGESVIDIGTGSGILAILAAKLGGIVCATDIDQNSTNIAKHNATHNQVSINFLTGEFFASFDDKFDVIIANLSQTLLSDQVKQEMGELSFSIDGGSKGNQQVLELLHQAPKHMHQNSRLYLNVYTISDYQSTIRYLLENYQTRLLVHESEPIKEFIAQNIGWYRELNQAGQIRISQNPNDHQWYAEQFLFELNLK